VSLAAHSSPTDPMSPRYTGSQLALDLDEFVVPSCPSWQSLPEGSRAEVLMMLARLLARAGLEPEPGV
jgi:hypothetical protein